MVKWKSIDELREIFINKYICSDLQSELEKACSEEYELNIALDFLDINRTDFYIENSKLTANIPICFCSVFSQNLTKYCKKHDHQ